MTDSAKQSITPRKERMDCFVASLLAMTKERYVLDFAISSGASLLKPAHDTAYAPGIDVGEDRRVHLPD